MTNVSSESSALGVGRTPDKFGRVWIAEWAHLNVVEEVADRALAAADRETLNVQV